VEEVDGSDVSCGSYEVWAFLGDFGVGEGGLGGDGAVLVVGGDATV